MFRAGSYLGLNPWREGEKCGMARCFWEGARPEPIPYFPRSPCRRFTINNRVTTWRRVVDWLVNVRRQCRQCRSGGGEARAYAVAYPSILLPLLLLGSIADKFLFSSHCMSELVGDCPEQRVGWKGVRRAPPPSSLPSPSAVDPAWALTNSGRKGGGARAHTPHSPTATT